MKMCRQLSGKSYFYSSCFAFTKIQVLLRILQGSKESAIEEILVFHYVKKEERLKGKEKKKSVWKSCFFPAVLGWFFCLCSIYIKKKY